MPFACAISLSKSNDLEGLPNSTTSPRSGEHEFIWANGTLDDSGRRKEGEEERESKKNIVKEDFEYCDVSLIPFSAVSRTDTNKKSVLVGNQLGIRSTSRDIPSNSEMTLISQRAFP
ncbi:hypothetical protein ACTXT7_006291 [Hymenolepis weldensis]